MIYTLGVYFDHQNVPRIVLQLYWLHHLVLRTVDYLTATKLQAIIHLLEMVLQAHEQVSGFLGLLDEVYGISNQVRGVVDYQSRRWVVWRGESCAAFFQKLGRLHKVMVVQVSALVEAEGLTLSSFCVLQTEDALVRLVMAAEKDL